MIKDPSVPAGISLPKSVLNKINKVLKKNITYTSRSHFVSIAVQEKLEKENNK